MAEVHVYTDGACSDNQNRKKAIGGIGVWFGKDDERNVSERLKGPLQTNNRAELVALIRAIEIHFQIYHPLSDKMLFNPLVLHTDSQYCKDGIEKWIGNWKKNGWVTANKKPVKNKDLWIRLDELRQSKNIRFEWVKGHAGIEGNDEADKLATSGCLK
jgi:ribonuclease HI